MRRASAASSFTFRPAGAFSLIERIRRPDRFARCDFPSDPPNRPPRFPSSPTPTYSPKEREENRSRRSIPRDSKEIGAPSTVGSALFPSRPDDPRSSEQSVRVRLRTNRNRRCRGRAILGIAGRGRASWREPFDEELGSRPSATAGRSPSAPHGQTRKLGKSASSCPRRSTTSIRSATFSNEPWTPTRT